MVTRLIFKWLIVATSFHHQYIHIGGGDGCVEVHGDTEGVVLIYPVIQ